MKLFIKENIVIVNNKFKDEVFIYDRFNHLKYDINEDMFEILNYIYKFNDINEKDFNDYGDINEVIDSLIEMDIISKEVQRNLYNIKVKENDDLERIFAEITNKCNLKCKHCYGSFDCVNNSYLNKDSLLNLIDEACKIGVYQFDMTGGEPLLYDDLEIILKSLYEHGMLVTLFTNLTLLSEDKLNLLKKYGVKKIITSVDSCIAKDHDEFRGVDGSFKRTIDNVKKIKDTSLEISINTMVGKHNYNHLKDTIEFLKELDLPCVIDSIVSEGRARDLDENMYESARKIKEIQEMYNNEEIYIKDCGVGKSFLYIKPNGNVTLCPSLCDKEEFIFSNLHNENFNLLNSYLTMRNRFKDISCKKKCSNRHKCDGGCRARTFAKYGNFDNEDLHSCILCGEVE